MNLESLHKNGTINIIINKTLWKNQGVFCVIIDKNIGIILV